MSTIMDPAKLKVVELRAELSSRGLDTKGNKPVLVKRLREALEAESGNEIPDTSIADTSTEDLNSSSISVSQPSPPPSEPMVPDKEPSPPPVHDTTDVAPEPKPAVQEPEDLHMDKKPEEPEVKETTPAEEVKEDTNEKMEVDKPEPEVCPREAKGDVAASEPEEKSEAPEAQSDESKDEKEVIEDEKMEEAQKEDVAEEKPEESAEPKDVEMTEDKPTSETATADETQDNKSETEKEPAEPRNRKSRWGSVTEAEQTDSGGADDSSAPSTGVTTPSEEVRGEKRRHASPSPERNSRRRSRSPIREDEPDIDNDRVQLSWIDSDLHLQVNKECFTSAEPLHNDGFGYMWAGVRSTHGVNTGKVWYEVKLVENCEWKDAPKKEDKDKEKEKNKEQEKEKNKDQEKEKNKDQEKEKVKEQEKELNKDEEMEEKEEKVEEENKPEAEDAKEEEAEKEPVPAPAPVKEEPIHMFRVGWSLLSTNLQLGEQPHSYGYDSDGLAATDSTFTEYGKKYSAGDVIGAFLDMESDPVTMTYTVNGEVQPTAFTVARSDLPENAALFPHLNTRNIKFEVNFGQKEEPWFQPPAELEGYTCLKDVEEKAAGLPRPEKRQDCEVVMMVGLPCSGKTQWVNNHVTENLDKKYNVLGLSHILDKMKYQGQSRKEHFKGSSTVLMDKCTRCLSKLVDLASLRRRNYILDQTNLFSSAQRRKLRPFDGFRRRAVVIVVADDEQTSREKSRQQADGKDVPDSAVLEMKANMCLPTVCEWLDEVSYVELDETKAKEVVQKYNKLGREAGYGPAYTAKQHNNQKQKGGNDRRGQWTRNNKRDNRDNRNNRWGGGSSGSGGGGGGHNRQNNWSGNRGSGNWSRHDNRNHHHSGGGGGGGGGYRNNSNNRMMSGGSGGGGGGGGYNRNQGSGGGGGGAGGYNRNRNQPPHRNQMSNKGGNWGGQGGGSGNWNNSSGNWNSQGGWGGHQSGGQGGGSGSGWSQGSWNQYGNNQGQGSGGQQWKGNYSAQQYQQQGYPQGYAAGQYGGQQYANWNYYGQYAQGWNAQQQGQSSGTASTDSSNSAQYNQYTQQQQAAWAQYAQSGYGGYGQASSQGGNAVTGGAGSAQPPAATK